MLQHLACIMDGNRRWAKRNGWLPWQGHERGLYAVESVTDFCLAKKIPFLSLYAFSLENFKRSPRELACIFDLILRWSEKELVRTSEKGVRIRFIGDRARFPKAVLPAIEHIETQTVHLKKLTLNLLFCYGGQQEIVDSMKVIFKKIKSGALSEDALSEQILKSHLWTGGMPEPDLIIRTGGMQRLSNFLLYQAAYAEFYFLNCLWPEITNNHLEKALLFFEKSRRNFGI